MNNSMIEIFRDKFEKKQKKIQKLLQLPKKDRNKHYLKLLLKEAKSLRKILKASTKIEEIKTCPHCGKEI